MCMTKVNEATLLYSIVPSLAISRLARTFDNSDKGGYT